MNTTPPVNGTAHEGEGLATNGSDEALAHSTSRLLAVADDHHLTPPISASSDSTNSIPNDLLARRGANRISPPFQPAQDQTAIRTISGQIQYLRPITPTEPLMGLDMSGTSLSTPTTEQLVSDGPMTPTNTAGPFVFDGSAGRAAIGTAISTGDSLADA